MTDDCAHDVTENILQDAVRSKIVIIGTGHAGTTAAKELRRLGHLGEIVLMGEEPHLPYERPPLSKEIVRNGKNADIPSLLDAEELRRLGIRFKPSEKVTSLDAKARTVRTEQENTETFDFCLLATGGNARTVAHWLPGNPGVHYVRRLDDAIRLSHALSNTNSLAVIGAGYLGLEIASSARHLGLDVTLLDIAPRVLARAAPTPFSDWVLARLRQMGINARLNSRIVSSTHKNGLHALTLSDGTVISAPTIVIAAGQVPNVELAENASIDIDTRNGGIVVNEFCQTSIPWIYAAGDCVSQFHPWYGNTARLESWQSANEQGAIAAAAMLGLGTTQRSVPWFWTDILGCNIQMLGAPPDAQELEYVVRGNIDSKTERPQGMLFGMQDDIVAHALAVNAGGDLRAARPLIERKIPVRSEMLLDTSKPLRAIIKGLI